MVPLLLDGPKGQTPIAHNHWNRFMPEITIDETADVAIWIQIRNRILYLIRSGSYKNGDRLPSVRELAVKLNINFNTVSKAYQDLERDGVIKTKRGMGTFVDVSDSEEQELEESPIDILISELVKTADSNGIANDELLHRINKQLSKRN